MSVMKKVVISGVIALTVLSSNSTEARWERWDDWSDLPEGDWVPILREDQRGDQFFYISGYSYTNQVARDVVAPGRLMTDELRNSALMPVRAGNFTTRTYNRDGTWTENDGTWVLRGSPTMKDLRSWWYCDTIAQKLGMSSPADCVHIKQMADTNGAYTAGTNFGVSYIRLQENKAEQCPTFGNPVQAANGVKRHKEVDFQTRGEVSQFRFTRRYGSSSNWGSSGYLGNRWRNTFTRRLRVQEHELILERGDGQRFVVPSRGGSWLPSRDHELSLRKTESGWVVVTHAGIREVYDSDGRLTELSRVGEEPVTVEYDDSGRMASVQSPTGRQLVFEYGEHERIARMATPSGDYSYAYDEIGNLTSVTYPDGAVKQYHYDNPDWTAALTSITDEEGREIGSWEYGDDGRVVQSSSRSGAGQYYASYSVDGGTTVMDPHGRETTYHFEWINGARRLVHVEGEPTEHCQGGAQSYEYNDDGLMTAKTDWDGTVTNYAYNSRGLRILTVEAAGTDLERRTETEWHSDLPLRTKVTEAGRVTEFEYDEQGRLLSRRVRAEQDSE